MSERMVQQPPAQESQSKFSELPTAEIERSTFDMSHPWKGTMDSGVIVPILNMEILPGDTISCQTTAFMRMATPLKPLMDGMTADIHYFFVANRLVWDNWQFFMGERKNVDDDPTTVSIPQINVNLDVDVTTGTTADYFGLPLTDATTNVQVNALPFRAYAKIWDDWYRNQNVSGETDIPTDDGPDEFGVGTYAQLKPRIKKADYFTKALPWPQKGDPVFLPLGTTAPITGISTGTGAFTFDGDTANVTTGQVQGEPGVLIADPPGQNADSVNVNVISVPGTFTADLTEATAATINDIRTAFQIQRLLERDARSGTRYIEVLLAHFNVQSPDFRLQRAEYLSGGSARIMINPVASTVATEDAPQGELAAVGTGLIQASMNHSFTEHGYLFALTSIRADLTYQNGLDRMWSRKTRYDFYWPALSHLGEQAILNKEIYLNGDETDEETWAYQERYAEYRYQPGRVTSLFRSKNNESLDVWHLSDDFETRPNYSSFFLYAPPPVDRVIAVPSEPQFIVDVWHKISATRPMPIYAVPGLVDHF